MRIDLLRIGLCLTLGLIPLAYMHDIYEFALLPKRFVFFAGLSLITLGWFFRTNWGRNLEITTHTAGKWLLGFVCFAIATTVQTTHPLNSLVEIAYQIALLNLFVIAASALNTRDISAMLWTTTLIGGCVALIGVLQYHNLAFTDIPTSGHPSATFGFRNFAAMYLVCAIPLAVCTSLRARTVFTSGLATLSTTLLCIYLIYTRTRGAWGGLATSAFTIGLATLLIPNLRNAVWSVLQPFLTRSKVPLFLTSLILIGALAPLSPRFENIGRQRIDEKKFEVSAAVASVFTEDGDRGRTEMWRNTLCLIRDHPIFGVGAGGWKRIYPPYDNGVMIRYNSSPVRPHNDYLWIAAEYGLIGLALYLGFLVTVFRQAYRSIIRQNAQTLILLASAVAVLAQLGHAFFSFPKEQPQATVHLYLLCGLIAGIGPKHAIRKSTARALLLLMGLQGVGAAILMVDHIRFDAHYLQTLIAEDHDDWQTVAEETRAGLALGSFRSHMWNIAGRSAEQQGNYTEAESAYRQTLKLAPFNWHAHNGLGIVYKRQGQFDKALENYREALRYFPGENNSNAVSIRTNLGALYKSMGKTEAAEREYRAILKSYPENAGANNNMGNLYKSRGQYDSARVAYETALQTDSTLVQAHFNLSDLFLRQKEPESALKHARAAAQLQPTDAQTLWNLGRTLEANRYIVPAMEAYRKAAQIDPTFAQSHFNLANMLFDLKRYAEAKEAYQTFISHWTGDASFVQYATKRVQLCEAYHRRQEAFENR